jgi:hypothetical protein
VGSARWFGGAVDVAIGGEVDVALGGEVDAAIGGEVDAAMGDTVGGGSRGRSPATARRKPAGLPTSTG